ncbi:hypothetical protein [Candidatus Phyllobacterium onerii]|uniref:hypothetical protein n=1 Tax=Candidatus Phyllobacterium onerii TaxID=3020828 RepID=UPI00232C9CE2|nr:hypothetical protein [Phyllobacterium sp. IY22]
MPFIDEGYQPQNLTDIAPVAAPDDPTLSETFGAAFRTENVIGSYLSSRGAPDPYQIEDGYDAIDDVKNDPKYAPYVADFAGIFNKKASDAQKLQIDRELKDKRTIDAAGGMGMVASMAAGVFDLPTLLPIGGGLAGAGGSLLRTASSAAIGAGIDAAVSETGLQLTQRARTGEESVYNIGGSILLGGALGTLIGRYLKPHEATALGRKIETQEGGYREFDAAYANAGTGASSGGAAARDTGPLVLKDEALIRNIPLVNRQDPLIRLQLSDFDSARQTVRGLAETPLEYADNAAGVATERGGSVETRMKMWHAPVYSSLRDIDTMYARYFHNAPEPTAWQTRLSPIQSEFARLRGSSEKMTYREFKEEVGKAAFDAEQHAIPEVAEAAKVYREVDDAMKRAAIEAGLLPEDVKVAKDASHLFRMYNKERIIAKRNEFGKILRDYFINGRESALRTAEENAVAKRVVTSDMTVERYNQSFERLSGIEDRINQRQDIRRNKVSNLQRQQNTRNDLLKERAPTGLMEALRNSDENASAIGHIREARAAEAKANKKPPYAERFPILAILKEKGGVRIGSPLEGELKALGITAKAHPGLFRKDSGIGAVDNFVHSEEDIFRDNLNAGDNGYVDPADVLNAIQQEVGGSPLLTREAADAAYISEAVQDAAARWLDSVGLGPDATVKQVRDFVKRVNDAEKHVDNIDTRILRLETEIEDFDKVTDGLKNERDISASEAAIIADEVNALEAELSEVADLANASPRVSMMVDYATTKRRMFKKRMTERNLQKRVDAIERLAADGKANDEMLMELAAKKVDLNAANLEIKKMHAKAEKLKAQIPSAHVIEKTDEFANLSDLEISDLVDETINTIIGNTDGRIPYDAIVSGPRGPLKERLLKIESAKIQDFMELDIEKVLRAQTRTMSADIEISKKFGDPTMKEEIRKIHDEADRRIAQATDDKQRTKLEKARKASVRDVEGIRDRLRGQYALPSNPDSLVLRAGRISRNLNYLRLLGGMTISAFPDLGKIVFNHGLTSTFRDGFIPLITNFNAVRLAGEEVKLAGTALDMVLDSRAMAMADITDTYGRHSRIERGIDELTHKYGVVSLMAPWNAAIKQFSGLVTMTNILNAAERVAKGMPEGKDVSKLAAGGIDSDLAERIAKEFATHGDKQGNVMLAKAADWGDREAREAFRTAVVREVDRIVVTPGQDKPLWMSTELGKTVGQFKSFGVSSMQRTMLAGLQQRDAATLQGLLVMMGLGAFTYYAKQSIAGREVSDDPAVWVVEAFDKSGVAGWFMDANNIAEKATRGRVGLSAITGKQVSRYASRNVTGAFLGPSADALADIFQVSGSVFAGDTSKSDLHKVRQLIPLQNLFYLRSILNQVEESAGNSLGLPDTRK